jgi:hypothetical protein
MEGLPDGMEVGGWRRGNTEGLVINSVLGLGGWRGGRARGGQSRGGQSRGGQRRGGQSRGG